jgi:Flp pilus assembly protein CpaB
VAGNRVDVWVGFNVQSGTGVSKPVERLLLQNVPVLSVGTGGNGGGNVTVRVNPADSGRLIYASQYGTIWLVLRPTVGGTKPPPLQVTAQSLVGTPAIQVGR